MKKWMTGLVAVLSVLLLVACGGSKSANKDTLTTIKEKGKLVVALSPDYAPFEFKTLVDGKSTIVGSDIELAKAIGDKLGVEVEFSPMAFDNVLATLASGKSDLAISGISPTPERAKVYDFSEVYYEAKNIVLVKKDDLATYASIDSLKGKSVGTQKGSIQEGVVQEQLPESNMVSLVQMAETVNQLKTGKLEAVVMEETIAKGYMAKNDDLAIAEITLAKSDDEVGSAVAMAKGNDKLKAEVDAVIKELRESGKIEQFVQEAYDLSMKSE